LRDAGREMLAAVRSRVSTCASSWARRGSHSDPRHVFPLGPDATPVIHPTAFVANSATVCGDVAIGEDSSVWYNAVLRGDVGKIVVGKRSNLQDGVVVHCARHNLGGGAFDVSVGDDVVVGHAAVLHACTLENRCMVGIGAKVLDGAVVESGAIVAAGSLVAPGTVVTGGTVWGGVPAKKLRDVREQEVGVLRDLPGTYVRLAALHVKHSPSSS